MSGALLLGALAVALVAAVAAIVDDVRAYRRGGRSVLGHLRGRCPCARCDARAALEWTDDAGAHRADLGAFDRVHITVRDDDAGT